MSTEGWVKLHRQLLDSEVFANPDLLRLFVWCLLKAGYTTRHVAMRTGRGSTEITTAPGQFVFGRKAAARELALPESTLYERVQKLAAMGCIGIQPGAHYSIVRIVNWGIYQGDEPDSRQATQQPTGAQPASIRHPSDTNKKGKKVTKDKKDQNSETDERARAMASLSWTDETARRTLDLAREVVEQFGGRLVKPGNRPNDRRVVLAASLAVVCDVFAEQWLRDAVERVTHKRAVKNLAAALTAELRKGAAAVGVDFKGVLEAADFAIPPAVMAGNRRERQMEQ